MDHLVEIAARIEEVRERRGMSIAELARRSGIDGKRLWSILRGSRAMRADEFVRVCAILDLEIYHFLTRAQARELRVSKLQMMGEQRRVSEVRDMRKGEVYGH